MKTHTVGELLQNYREKRRISLPELAQEIRVKQRYLEALEANQFSKLPAAVFVRGYIKSYGRVLDFDPEPLLALLRRDFQEDKKGTLLSEEFKSSSRRKLRMAPVRLVVGAIVTVFAVLFIYIGAQWYSLYSPPVLKVSSPAEDELVAAQVVVKGYAEADVLVTVNSQAVEVGADGNFEANLHLPNDGVATITIEARDKRDKVSTVQRTVFVRY